VPLPRDSTIAARLTSPHERKFWSSQEGFSDTKLAIVIFVRGRGLTAILRRARGTLGGHKQFASWEDSASETERAMMRRLGDDQRLSDLNVFFFYAPQVR
jgi:hypothetical protein